MKYRSASRSLKGSSRKHDRKHRYMAYFLSLVPTNLPSVRKLIKTSTRRLRQLLAAMVPPMPSFVVYLLDLWFKLLYYLYITLPFALIAFSWSLTITILYYWGRNSPLVKKFLIHASAIAEVLVNIGDILMDTSISILVVDGIRLMVDVVTSFLDRRVSEANNRAIDVPSMTFAEVNDLLYYEEMSDEEEDSMLYEKLGKSVLGFGHIPTKTGLGELFGKKYQGTGKQSMHRKMKQHMHQYIPPHTFRATIRVKGVDIGSSSAGDSTTDSSAPHQSSGSTSARTRNSSFTGTTAKRRQESPLLCPSEDEDEDEDEEEEEEEAALIRGRNRSMGKAWNGSRPGARSNEGTRVQDIVSPMSFPATPYSRARVMNKNAERVISTIFSARDTLRLELLSTSSDETSRQAAFEARKNKKMAVFDPSETSDGLSLTCGNHCLMKVGNGLCYSSRSMLPIRRDVYVYYEFSVTASQKQVPALSFGLSNAYAPLDTMVGSSEMSFGIRSDGRLLIRSTWYSPSKLHQFAPGSTIGFLVFIGSDSVDGRKEEYDVATADAPSTLSSSSSTLSTFNSSSLRSGAISPERGLEYSDPQQQAQEGNPSACEGNKPYLHLAINVDGNLLQFDQKTKAALTSILQDSLEMGVPLFPTVSILSPHVRVWCRFNEEDILLRNIAALGASKQTVGIAPQVYCLDGSHI